MNRREFIIGTASTLLATDVLARNETAVDRLILTQRYLLLEDNTVYDDRTGEERFRQLIGWNVDKNTQCLRVDFYRQLKDPNMVPVHFEATNDYRAIFKDRNVIRCLIGKNFRESHTPYDPEMDDRKFRPKDRRPDLITQS